MEFMLCEIPLKNDELSHTGGVPWPINRDRGQITVIKLVSLFDAGRLQVLTLR